MRVTIVAATRLEANAVRRAAPDLEVVEAGIGLDRANGPWEIAISCGLAGGLSPELRTGAIVIPPYVAGANGSTRACDPDLTQRLQNAARALGLISRSLPLVTLDSFAHCEQRAHWAQLGYAAADMETASIDARRIACVRVILDTPAREISPAWIHPRRALTDPRAWLDLPFLIRQGPRCAALAARVVARAFQK